MQEELTKKTNENAQEFSSQFQGPISSKQNSVLMSKGKQGMDSVFQQQQQTTMPKLQKGINKL